MAMREVESGEDNEKTILTHHVPRGTYHVHGARVESGQGEAATMPGKLTQDANGLKLKLLAKVVMSPD